MKNFSKIINSFIKTKQFFFLIILFLIVITGTVIYLYQFSKTSRNKKIKLELLWSKSFNSKIIKINHLSNFIVENNRQPEFPIKTVLTEKKLIIFNNKGKINKEVSVLSNERYDISKNGMVFAKLIKNQIVILTDSFKTIGTINLNIRRPVILAEHLSFALTPDGKNIIVLSYIQNTIYFYQVDGKLLNTHKIEYLYGATVKFSGNNKYVAIHIPSWGKGKTNGYLLLLTNKGKQLQKFDHKGCQADFDLSKNAKNIVIAAKEEIVCYNRKGDVILLQKDDSGGIKIDMSDDGRYLAVTKQIDHSVELIDIISGNTLWNFQLKGFDEINSPLVSLDISEYGNYISVVVGKEWSNKNQFFNAYIINKSGTAIWQKSFNTKVNNHCFSSDEKYVLFSGVHNIYLYHTVLY